MNNPIFCQTVSTKTITAGNRHLRNHNKLLWRFEGADGVKTGFTKAAGRILVSSATRQGRRLIAVTMDDPNDWQDHAELLQSGFDRYTLTPILYRDQQLGSVEVAGGQSPSVSIHACEDFSYPLSQDEEVRIVLPKPGFVYAPVSQGQEAGIAYVCIEQEVVGRVPVYYGDTVEQNQEEPPSFWRRLFGG